MRTSRARSRSEQLAFRWTNVILALLFLVHLAPLLHCDGPAIDSPFLNTFVEEVHGLIESDPALAPRAEALSKALVELYQFGSIQSHGSDLEMRPIFVNLQGAIEQTLTRLIARGEAAARGSIHTPTPATPCCTEGEISAGLVASELEVDSARLHTVVSRAAIVRSYLCVGGELAVVYPAEGIKKRSIEQQTTYLYLLEEQPERLVDYPLDCASLDHDLVGATYLFWDAEGREYAFSIRAPQANAPSDEQLWALWLGPTDHPIVKERVQRVINSGLFPFEF